jgi:thiamine kinase-like enzyme
VLHSSLESRVQAVIVQSLGWDTGTYSLDEFKLGLSNHVFLASKGSEKFVVRIFNPHTLMLNVDREAVLCFSLQAKRLGIGPNVIVLNDEFSVSEFLEGSHPEEQELLASSTLVPYMEILHRLHSCSFQSRQFNAIKWIDDFIRGGNERGAVIPKRLSEALRRLAVIERELKKFPEEWVPCHNDQNGSNFLLTVHGIMLLDWEYAGLNNPLYDLAKFAAHHNLSTEQSEILLAAYDGKLTDSRRQNFHLHRAIACLWQVGWMFFRSALPERAFDYFGACEQRLEEFFKVVATQEIPII